MSENSTSSEIKIPVPWGYVAGKWWGPRDQPPVICLHGWQDNASTFDTLAPLLPPQLSLLALDLPGQGFSSHYYPGQYYFHWWDSIILLRRVVKHLKLEKVSLMGHSRGGSVCFLYAATYPDEVDKLICIDSAYPQLRTPEFIADNTRANVDKFLELDGGSKDKGRCFERQMMLDVASDAYGYSVTREGVEVLMRRGMSSSPSNPQLFSFTRDPKVKLSGLGVVTKDLVLAYAKKISCEYLNIRAEPGISAVYPELYDQVLDIIKQSAKRFEYHRVQGKHHLHLNNPTSVVKIIGSFLTS
ncbi:probable serine hydrolase [Macrosteles quadrilineatus]|uniref:probable serine hydrolase n=1 Tax=Macrosteles quadrilineatus TaxID=74068 RepID=UPI0023E33661|nr:probable serine hydrolase [Macrosteles quadrilineatus]